MTTDIGKGGIVQCIESLSCPFGTGNSVTAPRIYIVESVYEYPLGYHCARDRCGHLIHLESDTWKKAATGGWCPSRFRKLSGPPDEQVTREVERDNPYSFPRIAEPALKYDADGFERILNAIQAAMRKEFP